MEIKTVPVILSATILLILTTYRPIAMWIVSKEAGGFPIYTKRCACRIRTALILH